MRKQNRGGRRSAWLAAALWLAPLVTAQAALVGAWSFDNPSDLFKADLGQPLSPSGTVSAVAGLTPSDGAVRVSLGAFLRCAHGIAANGGGAYVNEYSVLWDFKVPSSSSGHWVCLLQTNPNNTNDGELFARSSDGALGVSATGYSTRTVTPEIWYRLALSVKNGSWYQLYVNGELWLTGTTQSLDGRFSLDPTVLFAADENGEDYPVDFSRIAVYSHALTATEAAQLGGPYPADTVTFITPPYLQNLSPTGMVIMCETGADTPLRVEYGATASYGAWVDASRESSGNGTWFQRALFTGLSPASAYHYRVTATNGTSATADLTFRTAETGSVDFAFGFWSDSQGQNHGTWTAAPLEPTVSMMKHMAASGVAFGLTSGDLAENGASYSDTRSYYLDRVARYLGSVVPWYVAWGNHDSGGTNAPIRRASDLPSRYREGLSSGHGSYAFSYANCFFVCLDNFYEPEITNGWLEAQLSSAMAQQSRFRFVANHVPPYCERWINGDSTLRSTLVPLLERYRVAVCFSGHTHEYERGALNGVNYVMSGGASWLDFPEVVVYDWPHMTVGGAQNLSGFFAKESSEGVLGAPQAITGGLVNEYVKVTVRGSTLKLECLGFNADGSPIGVLDSVDLNPCAGSAKTWTGGGGNSLWSTAANWSGSVAPAEGDSLLFTGTVRTASTNLALSVAGGVTVASPGFTLSGLPLVLSGNISNLITSGQTAWTLPTSLGCASTFYTATGGTLSVGGALTNSGNFLTVDGGGNTTLGGAVSGVGGVTKSGTGTLSLLGTNTYSGGSALFSGSLTINSGAALGSGPLRVALASGGTFLTVANNGAVTVPNALALPAPSSAQTYTLVKNAAGNTTGTQLGFAGTLSGGNANTTFYLNTSVASDNTTTFRFDGANTFRATVNLNRGALVVGNPQGLGNVTNLIYLNANGNATLGDLRFAIPMTLTNPVQLVWAPSPISTDTNDVVLAGPVSGSGKTFTKLGSGTLTLLATNTFTGPTDIRAGTLKLGASGTLSSTNVTVAAGAAFDVVVKGTYVMAETNAYTLGVSPAGAGSAGRLNAATLDISGAKVALNVTGTLDDPVYVLATYSSLTGSRFASVSGVPPAYALVYDRPATAGAKQIALVHLTGTRLVLN